MDKKTLTYKLNSGNTLLIEEALDWIAENPDESSLNIITSYLKHPADEVRISAAYNLGILKSEGAIQSLIDIIIKDENESVKYQALYSLDEFNDIRIEKLLLNILNSDNYSLGIMNQSVKMVSNYPSEKVRQILIKHIFRAESSRLSQTSLIDSLFRLNSPELLDTWKKIIPLCSSDYSYIIANRGIIEIEQQNESAELIPEKFDSLSEIEITLELYRVSINLTKKIEDFLFTSLQTRKFSGLYAFGAVTIEMLITIILIEKGNKSCIMKLKTIQETILPENDTTKLMNYIEGTNLEKKYHLLIS